LSVILIFEKISITANKAPRRFVTARSGRQAAQSPLLPEVARPDHAAAAFGHPAPVSRATRTGTGTQRPIQREPAQDNPMLDLSQITLISGGQTGVDRAALDFALAHGITHGGWCPMWRLAEDGPIPSRYQLTPHELEGYSGRTRANVQDSDATLLVASGKLTPGTKLTLKFARVLGKPFFLVNLAERLAWPDLVREWMEANALRRLNVAGASESKRPGIHGETFRLLGLILLGE